MPLLSRLVTHSQSLRRVMLDIYEDRLETRNVIQSFCSTAIPAGLPPAPHSLNRRLSLHCASSWTFTTLSELHRGIRSHAAPQARAVTPSGIHIYHTQLHAVMGNTVNELHSCRSRLPATCSVSLFGYNSCRSALGFSLPSNSACGRYLLHCVPCLA